MSDVANAVLDLVDAVMLSGETTTGKYPIDTVKMMKKIIDATEKNINYLELLEKLEKKIIDDLIEDIVIDNEGNIRIIFKCEDKYFEALDFINKEKCDIIENKFLLA